MANPQKENGHIEIATEIVEALMKTNIPAYQMRVLWVVIRKTYGWQKKTDYISYAQFMESTNIKDIRNLARIIRELKERNIITTSKNGRGSLYSFQKDYEKWDTSSDTTSFDTTSTDTTSRIENCMVSNDKEAIVSSDVNSLSSDTNTKERKIIKDIVQKKKSKSGVIVLGS